jgi:hypothetical protein
MNISINAENLLKRIKNYPDSSISFTRMSSHNDDWKACEELVRKGLMIRLPNEVPGLITFKLN